MPVSATFHSSMTNPKPTSTPSGSVISARSPKPSATGMGAPSEVTEAQFRKWTVELQNKLVVQEEKQLMAERKRYKQHEDGKFWERKQALHKRTADQFGKAKMEVEAVRQQNLTRGAEYKAELEEMKEMAAQQREEWMQFGHELTVQHGPEQAERTKARLAETAEAKAEQGRQVKQEAQLNNKQRHTQRTNRLEEKRELVESTKQEEFSQPEESKNFSFHQKEEKVRSCAAPRHARSPPLPHGCTCCTPPAATPSPTASSHLLCARHACHSLIPPSHHPSHS